MIITDGKTIALFCCKKLSDLLIGVTSQHVGDFYCINCFHSYSAEKKLKKHNICKYHDYWYVKMPKEDNKILKYKHGENFVKVLFIIYPDLESWWKKWALVIIIPKNQQQPKQINITF